jgi:GTPase SAR1 family protein
MTSTLLLGKPGTGKTWLLRKLVDQANTRLVVFGDTQYFTPYKHFTKLIDEGADKPQNNVQLVINEIRENPRVHYTVVFDSSMNLSSESLLKNADIAYLVDRCADLNCDVFVIDYNGYDYAYGMKSFTNFYLARNTRPKDVYKLVQPKVSLNEFTQQLAELSNRSYSFLHYKHGYVC